MPDWFIASQVSAVRVQSSRRFFMLLPILCLQVVSFAQTKAPFRFAASDSMIRQAEIMICEHRSDLALPLYRNAYSAYGHRMSSRNLYHYFITAFDEGAEQEAALVLGILKCRGWKKDIFTKLLASSYDEELMKLLKLLYDRTPAAHCAIDNGIRRKVDSLAYDDWLMHRRFSESRHHPQQRTLTLAGFKKTTQERILCLAALNRHHYLSDTYLSRASPISDAAYDIILLHQAELQGWNSSWEIVKPFYEQMFRGIREGLTDADEFEQYVSSPAAFDRTTFQCTIDNSSLIFPLNNRVYFRINDSLYEWIQDSVSVSEYNRRRKAVPGLCDVETFRKKFIFQFYNPKYRFVSNVYLLNLSPVPDSLKQQLIYIKPTK